jgi:hypothetical protein
MFNNVKIKLFFIFLLAALAAYSFYRTGKENNLAEARKRVVDIAIQASLEIDPELHKQVNPDSLVINELTNSLNYKLYKITKDNPNIIYVYTLIKTNDPNTCKFVLTSDDYGKKTLEPDCTNYDVSSIPELKDGIAFLKPVATKSLYKDNWGEWITGYAPLKDKNGTVIATVGVDMSLKKIP